MHITKQIRYTLHWFVTSDDDQPYMEVIIPEHMTPKRFYAFCAYIHTLIWDAKEFVPAVKTTRNEMNWGLREAKRFCDYMRNHPEANNPCCVYDYKYWQAKFGGDCS